MRRPRGCAASVALVTSWARHLCHTLPLRGLEQIQDVPTSTDRKPRGFHRGPGKRQTSLKETAAYQFIKRWDLRMRDTWDDLEPFKGLPKPKSQFGNEATEIVWPYALLLERVVKVHPFTKSIYVYYSQRQDTTFGKLAADTAKAFSRNYLVPITFHNPQVYIETEMLLEYSETAWVVVHCLDGRHELLPVRLQDDMTVSQGVETLLASVVKACEALGSSVAEPREMTRVFNERPLQNQYLRINYQWFGDTPEERMSHIVQWDFDPASVEPTLRSRTRHVLDWLNYDGNLPNHNSVRLNVRRESARMRRPHTVGGPRSFFNSAGSRANARTPRFNKPS
ncbi:unnamed protein product [Phytomonas sp. EM1]|nr:unnamed protein product [Phytomonas sp. EM1]|eukprot:CCW60150.1 unnamed protein product [Phytomonas sp. isolate EM1]